jgi:hypothetical protein
MKVGQRIDCYNVKEGHHVFESNQTLIDNHRYSYPDLMYGFVSYLSYKQRCDIGISCKVGIDVIKVGTLVIKSIKS